MNHESRLEDTRQHHEVSSLIPWYVNASIGELERQQVEAHLSVCAACREDLALEQRIYRTMTEETAVEYMPAASLKRLQARLDGVDGETMRMPDTRAVQIARPQRPGRRFALRQGLRWQGTMAASVAVMAVAVGLLAADRWWPLHERTSEASYYTVTTPVLRAPGEVIRAVFSPNVTLVELQAILDESQLRIVAGPTEAGVYSLAAKSNRPVNSSLAILRNHDKVRFAESTQPEPEPDERR